MKGEILPPMTATVHVKPAGWRRGIRLWVPLFLFWLLLLPLAVLALPFLFVAARDFRRALLGFHPRRAWPAGCFPRHQGRSRKRQHPHLRQSALKGHLMNDNRRQVLEMLANGKITAEEAERLIAALERAGNGAGATAMSRSRQGQISAGAGGHQGSA